MPCRMPPSVWFLRPSGFEIGPQSTATTKRVGRTTPVSRFTVDFGDQRRIAVPAFVIDAGNAASADHAAVRGTRRGRRARLPVRRLCRRLDHADDPRVLQDAAAGTPPDPLSPAAHKLVHEAFVGERVLYAQRRTQRPGEEWRSHRMREGAFTANGASASAGAIDAPGEIGGHGVALIAKLARAAVWRGPVSAAPVRSQATCR